jgi:N-acetyl-gamma-glutamyl-phosphate reductase
MSSIDNLIKGAAGQAIQAWNVASGRDETCGLPMTGVTP